MRWAKIAYRNKLGGYAGPCQNLSLLISTWEGGHTNYGDHTKRYWHHTYNFAGLPVVFTEDNYAPGGGNDTAEGRYLADLFTYLYINSPKTGGRNSPIDPTRTRLRVLWYRPVNALGDNGGLFYGPQDGTRNGTAKPETLFVCPKVSNILKGTMPREYSSLVNTSCYP